MCAECDLLSTNAAVRMIKNKGQRAKSRQFRFGRMHKTNITCEYIDSTYIEVSTYTEREREKKRET